MACCELVDIVTMNTIVVTRVYCGCMVRKSVPKGGRGGIKQNNFVWICTQSSYPEFYNKLSDSPKGA